MCQIVYHPNYKKYNLGDSHPFNPIRVEMTLDLLNELGCLKKPLKPVSITPELLYEIHDPSYVDVVERVSNGEILKEAENYGLGSLDNPIVKGMAEGARNQAGGTLFAAGLLLENKAKKVLQLGGGFHHAHRNFAAGFCLYNDIALAVKEMTKAGWHVAYLDLDVHHGDGVQEIFYSDDKVMTISLHESGEYLFPGTGWIHELGRGLGRSLKLNLPLEPFTEGDSYLDVLNGVAAPALAWFKPDALVVQAGTDAHFSDPLADLMLTTQDFERIYRRVIELADQFCKGRALFTLGGGYSLTAAPRIWAILYLILFGYEVPDKIPQNFRKQWSEKISQNIPEFFHDPEHAFKPIPRKEKIIELNHELIQRMMDAVAAYWL
ncbi:acetoin utilization protein AcuC [bacterium BMS3Bbin03]|nr:acetoin utilization protein AcuC [bacterium BMS3Bbin03]